MKYTLSLAALAMCLAAPAAFAQMPAPPVTPLPATQLADAPPMQHRARNPHKAAVRIGKELGLSDDQTARLEPILADRQQKVQAVRANTSLTDTQRKQQRKTIQQTARMQMGQVLSPDQMKQLHKMRKGREQQDGAPTGA